MYTSLLRAKKKSKFCVKAVVQTCSGAVISGCDTCMCTTTDCIIPVYDIIHYTGMLYIINFNSELHTQWILNMRESQ